jgi:5-methylcytosine-specific restriction protein A
MAAMMPQRPITMRPIRTKQRVQVGQQHRGKYDHRWRALRRLKLDADPMCVACERNGIVTPANEVDHIVPVSTNPDGMFDYDNLQSLCKSCHSRKTRNEINADRGRQALGRGIRK